MPIPYQFDLFGQTHKIKKVKLIDRGKALGQWNPDRFVIHVATTDRFDKSTICDDSQEQAYYHEVVHAILDGLSYEHLSADEKFVDTFSKALHQILKTSKYK